MIKVLLIGGGAREHALARALKNSSKAMTLYYCAPVANPRIDKLADSFLLTAVTAVNAIVDFAAEKKVSFAIIGPEIALAAGLVDELKMIGVASIGPEKSLARIETSKGFARELMHQYRIKGLTDYRYFKTFDLKKVTEYLDILHDEYVIKADGLCGGKGVKVFGEHLHTREQALAYCQEIDAPFVIEKKCRGPEFSLISLSDGYTVKHLPVVQDHKRAFENDEGPNTGGMGSYTLENHLLPFLSGADVSKAQAINESVITALQDKFKKQYVGILYGGYMLTEDGVKVIEFNARLGDPEAINLLALLETDFAEVCHHLLSGTLNECELAFKKIATVVKYVVPNGYPNDAAKEVIDISEVEQKDQLYFGAVMIENKHLVMTGSRAVAVLGEGDTLADAETQAQSMVEKIQGPVFYRKDIGTKKLIDRYTHHDWISGERRV